MVLRANRSSWSPRPAFAASIFASMSCVDSRVPRAMSWPSLHDVVADDLDGVALVQALEDGRTHVVDERHARAREQQWTDVGIRARDRRRGVDDDLDAGLEEPLGAHSVHVDVVDDGDVFRTEALGEVLGPLVDACDALVAHSTPESVGTESCRRNAAAHARMPTANATTRARTAASVTRPSAARAEAAATAPRRAARVRARGSPRSRCPRACGRSRRRAPRPRRARPSVRGLAALDVLAHDELRVGERRDLRQVRDDDDLVAARELGEPAADRGGGRAADTGVDLVEHERLDGVRLAENALEREHDARELAARGDARERPRGLRRRGCVEELDALRSRRRSTTSNGSTVNETSKRAPLIARSATAARQRLDELRCGRLAYGCERVGSGAQPCSAPQPTASSAARIASCARVVRGKRRQRLVARGEHVLEARPVLLRQTRQRGEAREHLVERGGIVLDAVAVRARLGGHVVAQAPTRRRGARRARRAPDRCPRPSRARPMPRAMRSSAPPSPRSSCVASPAASASRSPCWSAGSRASSSSSSPGCGSTRPISSATKRR